MRTAQRDQNGLMTFGARFNDAPSGSGVAQPHSILWTFTRTSTGIYSINFDVSLMPMISLVSSSNIQVVRTASWAAGMIQVVVESPAGTLSNNGVFWWQVTARRIA